MNGSVEFLYTNAVKMLCKCCVAHILNNNFSTIRRGDKQHVVGALISWDIALNGGYTLQLHAPVCIAILICYPVEQCNAETGISRNDASKSLSTV